MDNLQKHETIIQTSMIKKQIIGNIEPRVDNRIYHKKVLKIEDNT